MSKMMLPIMMMGAVGLSCMVAVGGGALFLMTNGLPGTTDPNADTGGTPGFGDAPAAPVTSTSGGGAPGKGKSGEYDFGSGGTYTISDGINYLRMVKGAKGSACKYNEQVKSDAAYIVGDTTKKFALLKVSNGTDGKIFYRIQNAYRADSCPDDSFLTAVMCTTDVNMVQHTGKPESSFSTQWWFVPDPKDKSKILMQNRQCVHNGTANTYLNLRPGQAGGRVHLVDETNASRVVVSPA